MSVPPRSSVQVDRLNTKDGSEIEREDDRTGPSGSGGGGRRSLGYGVWRFDYEPLRGVQRPAELYSASERGGEWDLK